MMGLLDGTFDTSQPGAMSGLLGARFSADDTQNTAAREAVMRLALGLMSTPGSFGQALGQSGMGAMDAYQQSMQRQRQQKMQDFQFQQAQQAAQRAQAMQALPQQFMRSPGPVMPATQSQVRAADNAMETGSPQPPAPEMQPGGFDMNGYAQALAQYDPQASLAMQASLRKDTTPIKLGAGDSLVDPNTYKPLFTNPKESQVPEALRAIEQVYGKGSPEYIKAERDYITKLTTHQPSTQVNVNTEKPLLNSVATGLGKQIDESLGNAKGAVGAIQTAQQLRAAIDSGKVISGPGASFRIAGLQIGQQLGLGGKDAAETLANTRTAIQSMAQGELAAAQQMKGQGQITEAERDIIKRASSGDITSLTGPEIRLLSEAMEKTARFKIKQHQTNVEALRKMPDAAPLLPFYQVDQPAPYAAPTGSANAVRRYNPATGKIE